MAAEAPRAASCRLDKWLWFVRLVRQRRTAQAIAEAGHLRIGGRRIDRAAAPVRVGDVLSFFHGGRVRVVRVAALPDRRGGAAAAAGCYTDLSVGAGVEPPVDLHAGPPLAGPPEGARTK